MWTELGCFPDSFLTASWQLPDSFLTASWQLPDSFLLSRLIKLSLGQSWIPFIFVDLSSVYTGVSPWTWNTKTNKGLVGTTASLKTTTLEKRKWGLWQTGRWWLCDRLAVVATAVSDTLASTVSVTHWQVLALWHTGRCWLCNFPGFSLWVRGLHRMLYTLHRSSLVYTLYCRPASSATFKLHSTFYNA